MISNQESKSSLFTPLLIGSKNRGKIQEFYSFFKNFSSLKLFSLIDFPDCPVVEETGTTFEENAYIKAEKACQYCHHWVIADDSGLVVPALNGAPGVISARYAKEGASDKENRDKLLKLMSFLQGHERYAYYECCIVLKHPDKEPISVKGRCFGKIAYKETGTQGFGYDSIFIEETTGVCFGQMPLELKNKLSHRKKAFDEISISMKELFC